MITRTVFHLDDPRPLAWGRKKKEFYIYYPHPNEDVVKAKRNREILVLIDQGSYKNNVKLKVHPAGKHIAKMNRRRSS